MKMALLYGTETGNSEMLCEDIETELGAGFECAIDDMGNVDPTALDPEVFYIFVTSTYGNGDLPQTAAPFADKMDAEKPDLSAIRFAIFGLGDMVFEQTFAHGSKTLMEKLIERGATMIGERGIHDASGMDLPEDIALPWVNSVMDALNAKAA